ncbi:hypothetical protein [Ideonella sp.]|jgi:hypothetical protein|uniref:hypothetical protein n=1 Tax=Ideonella sp. TaxID=1929293 RepID=UPI0037BEA253
MSRDHRLRPPAHGFTLIELCLATAMGALLLAALAHVARLATESKVELSGTNEQRIQTEFVMQRLQAAARAATVGSLLPDATGDTGLWLAPKRFCINDAKALVETTTSASGCSGGEVIADRVSHLGISIPETQSALDTPMAQLSVALTLADGSEGPILSQSIRLKGLLE